MLADDDVSPDPDALRLSVYPAGSLLDTVYASAPAAVAVVPASAGGNVTVPDNPDSDTISLTLPLAVTEPDELGLTQAVDPEAGWEVPAGQAVSLVWPGDGT
jgi:hypothetical protein